MGAMGLFDEVYVSADVARQWQLGCDTCGRVPAPEEKWQTKAFDPCLCAYYLRCDERGDIRLYALDRPRERSLWRPWTAEEIAESEREAERGGVFELQRKRPGDGRFLPEAFLPEHRRQRSMGELPHQRVELHTHCPCGAFLAYRSAVRRPRNHEPLERHAELSSGTAGPGCVNVEQVEAESVDSGPRDAPAWSSPEPKC